MPRRLQQIDSHIPTSGSLPFGEGLGGSAKRSTGTTGYLNIKAKVITACPAFVAGGTRPIKSLVVESTANNRTTCNLFIEAEDSNVTRPPRWTHSILFQFSKRYRAHGIGIVVPARRGGEILLFVVDYFWI